MTIDIERMVMVTAQVRDFDSMASWYQEVLGLTVVVLEPGEFCLLATSQASTMIALAADHPDRISGRPGVGWTPIVKVHDFDAVVAALRDRGVDFDAEEEGGDEGYRLVRVLDPEGNPIGITT